MSKLIVSVLLTASALFAQWKAEPAGAPPPSELNASVVSLLNKDGLKITNGGKEVATVWFRSSLPAAKNDQPNVTLTNVTQGELLGAVKVDGQWSDRRGQQIKPGVYTLRYSMFPQNGDHQGVAPQRDFLLLVRAADDTDGNANLDYGTVTKLSMKATGTPHPGVISLWKGEAAGTPGITQAGETDQVLNTKIGDTPVAIIVFGKVEA
jgi:hypothetical protein